jgi:hypothetical protein
MHFLSAALLFLAPLTLALPISDAPIEARACDVQCGSTCYTNAQVASARAAGYKYYSSNSQAGSSTYPHKYNNYEGFDFPVNGPYQEFPLRTSGAYTGGMSLKAVWDAEMCWTDGVQARLVRIVSSLTRRVNLRARSRTLEPRVTTLLRVRKEECCVCETQGCRNDI